VHPPRDTAKKFPMAKKKPAKKKAVKAGKKKKK